MTGLRNTSDDCSWLRETHLRGRLIEFKSFSIVGNVDFPDELTVYANARPTKNELPVAVFRRTEFGLTLHATSEVKTRAKISPTPVELAPAEPAKPAKSTWLDFARETGCLSDSPRKEQ